MTEIEKGKKKVKKPERPVNDRMHAQPGASGVPSSGGSRQGNIGHQGSDDSDNSRR